MANPLNPIDPTNEWQRAANASAADGQAHQWRFKLGQAREPEQICGINLAAALSRRA